MTHESQYPHRKSDALVAVIKQRNRETVFYRAKRVGKICPLTRAEIHVYVTQGPIRATSIIKAARGLTLSEAVNLLKSACFPNA